MWQGDRPEDISKAAKALRSGALVAFPTETVYGLGADGLNENACRSIFKAKGRPADNPLILHIADFKDLHRITKKLPAQAESLAEAFWPGPLTLIMQKAKDIPKSVTAGLDTVAVRMPDHPIALALILKSGRPLAAPSANISGRPSPTSADHVLRDFGDSLGGIVDGGPCEVGLESTILDLTTSPPTILRPGAISKEALEAVIGPVAESQDTTEAAPKAPGMKYRHYAPRAPLTLLREGRLIEEICQLWEEVTSPIGFLLSDDTIGQLPPPPIDVYLFNMGPKEHPKEASQRLFSGLRYFDDIEVSAIYAESWPEKDIGQALMNRLRKAAGGSRKEDAL